MLFLKESVVNINFENFLRDLVKCHRQCGIVKEHTYTLRFKKWQHLLFKSLSRFSPMLIIFSMCLQCVDAVGWAARRASGL